MADTTVSTKSFNKTNIKEGDILFGLFLLLLFIIGLTLQTATTEASGQHVQDTTVWNLFWSTLMQLPGMVTGSVHISDLPRLLIGWGIEAFYYMCLTGHKRLKQSTEGHHPWAIFALDGLAIACVGYCMYTDWTFVWQLTHNFWECVLLTGLISGFVAVCGGSGWGYLKSGFGR